MEPLLQHRPAPLAGLVLPGQGESVFLVEMPRRVQSGEGVEMDLAEPGPAAEIHGRSQQQVSGAPAPGFLRQDEPAQPRARGFRIATQNPSREAAKRSRNAASPAATLDSKYNPKPQ